MRKINKIIDRDTPSILPVFLSYFAFNWRYLHNSKLYNTSYIFIFILITLVTQFIIYNLFYKSNKLFKLFAILFYTLTILTLYSYNVADILNIWQIKIMGHQIIRVAHIIPLVGISLFFIELFLISKKKILIKSQNVFFILLSIISMLNPINTTEKEITLKNNFIHLNTKNNEIKPVVLIIVDEYNSPDGLASIFQDGYIHNFSNELLKKKWIIKKNIYSYETSTIHSISSLFNFNLSIDKNYQYMSVNNIGTEKLMKAALIDSLFIKGVKILNYGIFDLGENKPLNRLYYYPRNFYELMISNSVIPFFNRYISEINEKNKQNKVYLSDIHNKRIYSNLIDTLEKTNESKLFVYTHLYMPHSPFIYDSEFKYRESNLKNYLEYWKFTNSKLNPVLDSLTCQNKYRIILTGDHGYRDSKLINPHYTFCAFYGFNEKDIMEINSVQDLGSIIYSYLNL